MGLRLSCMALKRLARELLLPVALFTSGMLGQTQVALAATPTRAAIDNECSPGSAPVEPGDDSYPGGISLEASGLTPQHLEGVTTVSVDEAKCIVDRFGEAVVVIAAMDDRETLPNAHRLGGMTSKEVTKQAELSSALKQFTGGDLDRPILVYCHHRNCFLSYNAALRIMRAGYRQVFWMRSGIAGWKKAGYATSLAP